MTIDTQTKVVNVPEHHAKRTDIISVTPENFHKFVDNKMGIVNESPEAIAAKELEVIEAKKAADDAAKVEAEKIAADPTHDLDEKVVGKDKKGKLNERFSELTTARKTAEEAATKALAEAKELFERSTKAEKEAAELRAKYEPIKTVEEIGVKPDPTKYTDVAEYSKDLEKWVKDTTLAESRKETAEKQAKQEQEAKLKSWNEREAEVKTAIPDYEATINASNVSLSDQVRDAIFNSEVGPQFLYHFAKNPDVAEAIGKMTIEKALIQLGKIEAGLTEKGTEAPAKKTTIAEISKAPKPITPITAGVGAEVINEDRYQGPNGFERYKQDRKSGKLK